MTAQKILISIICLSIPNAMAYETCDLGELEPADSAESIEEGFELGEILGWTQEADIGNKTLTMEPTVNLGLDWGRRVTNLSPSRSSRLLTPSRRNDRFKVEDNFSIEGGIGISGSIDNSTGVEAKFLPLIGLLPMKGAALKSVRYVSDQDSAYSISKIKLPLTEKTFDQLNSGDSVSYASTGGILFTAGVGVSEASLSLAMVARGDFETKIEKVSEGRVLVSIQDQKLRSVAFQKGALIVEASVEQYYRTAKTLSYLVNYKTNDGKYSLVNFLKGNVAPVQKLAAKNSDSVVAYTKGSINTVGNNTSLSFYLPLILDVSWTKGGFFEKKTVQNLICNQKQEAVYSAYSESSEKSVIELINRSESATFYGVAYKRTAANGRRLSQGLYGELLMRYENEYGDSSSLRKALRKIEIQTGLKDILNISVPSLSEKNYAAIELRMKMGTNNTKNLITSAISSKDAMISKARRGIKTYLKQGSDVDGLCTDMPKDIASQSVNRMEACYQYLVNETTGAINTMWNARRKLKRAIDQNNPNRAAKAYSLFGSGMLANRFAFQVGTNLAGRGIQLEITVEGSEFARYQTDLRSEGSAGTFALTSGANRLE